MSEGDLLGELDRGSRGRAIDWGSPEVLDQYGSLEHLFVWSSPEEGGSSGEEDWFLESSTSLSATSGVPESIATFPATPAPQNKTSTGALHTEMHTFQQKAERASDSVVLPGRGRPKELPRLSQFQRDIQRRVVHKW